MIHPQIERIFSEMALLYGTKAILEKWASIPLATVKAAWQRELGGFVDDERAIDYALGCMHARFVPTAREFRELCAACPPPVVRRLPMPEAPREMSPQAKACRARLQALALEMRMGVRRQAAAQTTGGRREQCL